MPRLLESGGKGGCLWGFAQVSVQDAGAGQHNPVKVPGAPLLTTTRATGDHVKGTLEAR